MTKKDKKEDVERISKIMGEDTPEEPAEEEPKAEPTEEPKEEKPEEEPKEEKSLDEMSKDLDKEEEKKKPKMEEKPKADIQQLQVRMTRAISLGFNIAIGFWLFTIILGLILGVVLVAFFDVQMPF